MSDAQSPFEIPPPPLHRHEVRDADVRKLAWMGAGLIALVIFGFIVAEGAFHFFVRKPLLKPPSALFSVAQMPPKPLLQEHVGLELQQYLKQQNAVLDSYGWVDRKAGVVRIPVDRAMDILLQKGLPVRKPGQVTLGVSAPHTIPRGDFGPPPEGISGPRPQ